MTGFQNPEVILQLPDLEIPDLEYFGAVIPQGIGVTVVGGRAHVEADLDLTESTGGGELRIRGEDVVLNLRGRRLTGGLELDVRYAGGFEHPRLSIAGTRLLFENPQGWSADFAVRHPTAERVLREVIDTLAKIGV